MKKIIFIIWLLGNTIFCFSQETGYWMQKQLIADTLITDFKGAILLVQLNPESDTLHSKYRKMGSQRMIKEIFKNDFDFCKVCFYYQKDSVKLVSKLNAKIRFETANGNDTILDLNNLSYYIANFAAIIEDSSRTFDGYYFIEGENGPERRARYTGAPGLGFQALVLYDSHGNQLPKPFPYYVRTYDAIWLRRNPITVVKKMNSKLKSYYSRRAIKTSMENEK